MTQKITLVATEQVDENDPNNLFDIKLKQAKKGDIQCMFDVGLMYDEGKGVPRDYKEAIKWYIKAAEYGHATAQSNLGEMYFTERGVPKDYVQSYKWLNIAASKGHKNAKEMRDRLETNMTIKEISDGQKLSNKFRPKD